MAKKNWATVKEAAGHLVISYMTLYKIMDRKNKPTVEHGQLLCNKAGYSAEWLFMNRGEMYHEEISTMKQLIKEVQKLKNKL